MLGKGRCWRYCICVISWWARKRMCSLSCLMVGSLVLRVSCILLESLNMKRKQLIWACTTSRILRQVYPSYAYLDFCVFLKFMRKCSALLSVSPELTVSLFSLKTQFYLPCSPMLPVSVDCSRFAGSVLLSLDLLLFLMLLVVVKGRDGLVVQKEKANSYQGAILLSRSFSSARLRKAAVRSENCWGRNRWGQTVCSQAFNSFSVLDFQGILPVSISKKVTPMAQMSLLQLYLFSANASQGMQWGEPILSAAGPFQHSPASTAKPKSPIITYSDAVRKMLEGLMSLWMRLWRWMERQPFTICSSILMALASSILPSFLMSSPRVPFSQSGVMMYMLFLVQTEWARGRMLGLSLSILRACISEEARWVEWREWWCSLGTTLMETICSGQVGEYL